MLALMDQTDQFATTVRAPRRPPAPVPALGPAASPLGGPVQFVPARGDLFLDGDAASHAFEVIDGIVCAYRILPDGERRIIGFYYPGDVLGYCCLETHGYSAQALTAARVRRIPRAMLERMIEERPELAQRFLRMAAVELTATRDHLVCLAAKSAGAKVASLLLALSRRNRALGHDPAQIRLSMTRTDIGDYLGLTIETVSRMLNRFKRQGLIDLPRATHVVIRNLAGLHAITDA